MGDIDYRKMLLSLIGSLTLADHIGDAAGDCRKVLADLFGQDVVDNLGWEDVGAWLGKEHGVQTVWGTDLYDPEDDEDGRG